MSIPVYILKRILSSIPTIIIVSMLGFLLMRYNFTFGPIDIPLGGENKIHVMDTYTLKNPIDPLAHMRNNPAITQSALEQEEQRLGLDQPMHVQYWRWVSHIFQFNFDALGSSKKTETELSTTTVDDETNSETTTDAEKQADIPFFKSDLGKTFTGDDVASIIMKRAGNTALLNVIVLFFSWLIAIPLGIYAALNWRSTTDRLMTALAAMGMSFPSFVLALILAVIVVKTGILPLGGANSDNYDALGFFGKVIDRLKYLVVPAFVLTIGGLAGLQRQMRGNLLDVLEAEYVRTARAKGLPEHVVIYKHAVRTAINPLITMLGYEFAAMLSGALLIETVLGYPGLGSLMYRAVLETDTNLVMATLIMSSMLLILGNLMADILLKLVDPRIELN